MNKDGVQDVRGGEEPNLSLQYGSITTLYMVRLVNRMPNWGLLLCKIPKASDLMNKENAIHGDTRASEVKKERYDN